MTTIRPATTADAAHLAVLAEQLGYPTTALQARTRLDALVAAGEEATVLVAVDRDDRALAWLHVARVRTLTDDAVAVIHGFVVEDGRRSEGIGRGLLDAAESWARDHGATEIVVRTRTTRSQAHRFYEREGFRLVKESRVYAKAL